jgi:hypothetical protein
MRHRWVTILLILAAAAAGLVVVGRRIASRPMEVRLSDSGRVTLARGPLGDLLRVVEDARMKPKASLKAGTYRLKVGSRPLELQVDPGTDLKADIDFGIAAAGEAPEGPWVEPRIATCRLDFSRPVRIGAGLKLAVSSVALHSGAGLTGEVEPAYARTLGSLLVGLLHGAGRAGANAEVDRIFSSVEVASASLRLKPGAEFPIGMSRLVIGPDSSATLRGVRIDPRGSAEGRFGVALALAERTRIELSGLRLRPRSALVTLAGKLRVAPGGTSLELETGDARNGLTLDDAELSFDAKGPATIRVGRLVATLGRWSYAEGPKPRISSSELEVAATVERGALALPVNGGSLDVTDLGIPALAGSFRRKAGRESFRVELPRGLSLGRSTLSLAGPDGTRTRVVSAGLETRPVTATAWRDLVIDLSSVDLRPSEVVVSDRSGRSITMHVGAGSSLSAKDRLAINLAGPRDSTLPPLTFRGSKMAVLADLGGPKMGLGDVDARIEITPGSALTVSGTMRGQLRADGLPGGVADLVNRGRLRAEDLKLAFDGGAARVASGRLEVRLPQDQVVAELRSRLTRPVAIPDKPLGVGIPEVFKDATAAGMTATVQVPSLRFGPNQIALEAKADVHGRVDVKNRFRKLSMQMRQIGPIKTNVPVYEERWTGPEKLTDFSGTLSAHGVVRFSVVGGDPLLEKRVRFDVACDRATIKDLRISNTIVDIVVKAVKAVAGGAIEGELRKALSQNFELDPFARLSPQDRAWLGRITLKSFSVDAQGGDVVISGPAEFR